MIKESIKMSWSNIIHNKMRSFLTILGIIIGVASIIALISVMQSATYEITDQISALGADRITLQISGTALKSGLSENDLENLSDIENISNISPTIQTVTSVSSSQDVQTNVSIQGKNQNYFKADDELVADGRTLNVLDIENSTYVAIIGNDIREELYVGVNPIGEKIIINGHTFTIVGVLKDSGQFSFQSVNDNVVIPYTTAMKVLGVHSISNVDVYMSDSSQSEQIVDDINLVLNQAFNYKEDSFSIFNMQDMLNALTEVTDLMALLLAGIASISLIVGGIGIMNMMLVSVTERTTEIGLRKALGAVPSRIQLQFIIESIFLSMFGGFFGLVLGAIISFVVAAVIDIQFILSASTVLLAVGFSAGIGIIFGFMPARKASKLNPIDALRHI